MLPLMMKNLLLVLLLSWSLTSLFLIHWLKSQVVKLRFEIRILQMWKASLLEDSVRHSKLMNHLRKSWAADLAQVKYLLEQLKTRLATDLEQWSRFASLAQSPTAKEMAQAKVSELESQLVVVKDLVEEKRRYSSQENYQQDYR